MPDLFEWYDRMRAEAPVWRDAQHGAWNMFLYDDVKTVLSDSARFSSQRGRGRGSDNPESALADSLISTDPPRHRDLRALVEKAFTPRAVQALAPRIKALVDGLLDDFDPGETDFVRDFAVPLPVTVIAEILGIPAADRDSFKRWSDAVIVGDASGSREMAAYFTQLVARRRAQGGGEDLISALIRAEFGEPRREEGGQHLTGQELIGFCMLLLVAGNETTTNLLSNAVQVLSDHPGAREQLAANPELWPGAVEEVLRYRSPVQSMFRVVARDTELGGQRLGEGDWAVAWIGSANLDGGQFPDAASFDPARNPNRHLAFGQGIHFCLGAPLARLEADIALRAVYERFPHLRVREGVSLTLIESSIVHGVRELPVELLVSA